MITKKKAPVPVKTSSTAKLAIKAQLRLEERFDILLEEFRLLPKPEGQVRDGKCTGRPCKGTGWAAHYVQATSCPKPCDETQYTEATKQRAKERALSDATVNCRVASFNSNCECKDGDFKLIEKVCELVEINGVKYCEYRVVYEYAGRCLPRAKLF